MLDAAFNLAMNQVLNQSRISINGNIYCDSDRYYCSSSDEDSLASNINPFESVSPINPESKRKLKRGAPPSAIHFPWKVHKMLDDAIEEGHDHIVSWDGDGDNGFMVHNKDAFVRLIVPRYFSQTKYRSFQRMLNMWGFEKITKGPKKGTYIHACFRRGQPELCHRMKCQRIKRRHASPSRMETNDNAVATTRTES